MFWVQNHYLLVIPCIIIGFTVHEFFHAYVSFKLGDYTVKEDGRLTLNPIKHIDWIGFVSLIILGFGWAKPVQVDPHYYRKPMRGMMLVSLAGPLSNLVLAIVGIILNLIFRYELLGLFFTYFWMINLGMCIFNLFPIPPLDGSKIFGYLVNGESYRDFLQYERYGFMLVIILAYLGVFSYVMNIVFDFVLKFIY